MCCIWELQVPTALQYRFKIFNIATGMFKTLIKTVSAFFLIICIFLEIKHSFKMGLNGNSWGDKSLISQKPQRIRKTWDTV